MFYKTLLIGFMLSLVIAFYGKASFGSSIVVMGSIIYIGIPAIVISFLIYLFTRKTKDNIYFLKLTFNLVILCFIVAINHNLIGGYFHKKEMSMLKDEAEQIINMCDKSFIKNGSYPKEVNHKNINITFWSNGREFQITIPDRTSMMRGIEYNSNTKKWGQWD